MEQLSLELFEQIGNAIESAQILAWRLASRQRVSNEARELYSRLESARIELESLRVVSERLPARSVESDWLIRLGWNASPARSD